MIDAILGSRVPLTCQSLLGIFSSRIAAKIMGRIEISYCLAGCLSGADADVAS